MASSNPKTSSAIKSAKQAHDKHISAYHFKMDQKNKEILGEGVPLDEKTENEDSEIKVTGKRKKKKEGGVAAKKQKFKDENYYVPHAAPDSYTEKELAVNNFADEANKAAFDITGDNEEGLKTQKQLKKWDKKKKKMVDVPVSIFFSGK